MERAASWLAGGGACRAGGGAGGPAGPGRRAGQHHRPALRLAAPHRRSRHLATLTVRAATALLTAPAAAERDQRLAAFAALAAAAPSAPPPAPEALPDLKAALRSLWRLPWNARKEQYWCLAHDALPTAARLHKDQPCDCGAPEQRPGRLHHFWTCPVARAVVSDIEAALAAAQPGAAAPPLARAAIWLALAPAGVHPGVWTCVGWCAWPQWRR